MIRRAAVVLMAFVMTPAAAAAQAAAAGTTGWVAPRTPDGQPDLQGVWDYRTATPLERPADFAGKEFLTDQEIAEYERRAAARDDGRPPDDPRSDPSVHPPWWLDYGRSVVGTRRSSLVVDPSDGRIPALTADGAEAGRRTARRRPGPRTCRLARGPDALGAVHHSRPPGRDAARRLQQQRAVRADAGDTS